jgi:hypothetical protein
MAIANAELIGTSSRIFMNPGNGGFTSNTRSAQQLQRPRRQLRALRRLRRSFLSIKIHALYATEHSTECDVKVRIP